MPMFMAQFAHTPQAWTTLIQTPQDRAAASDTLLRHFGGRLIGLYYTPGAEYDGFALFEAPSDAAAAAVEIADIALGHLRSNRRCACSRPKKCVRRFSKRPRRRILLRRPPTRAAPELDCECGADSLDRARKEVSRPYDWFLSSCRASHSTLLGHRVSHRESERGLRSTKRNPRWENGSDLRLIRLFQRQTSERLSARLSAARLSALRHMPDLFFEAPFPRVHARGQPPTNRRRCCNWPPPPQRRSGCRAVRGANPIFSDPFTLGVASGSPTHDSVVLWTRLAPESFFGADLAQDPITVRWEMAHDERFTRIVAQRAIGCIAALADSVHVEVGGLEPDRWYFYRFMAGEAQSAVGRTRTFPAPGAAATLLRIAYASCQRWEHGYFSAYRHMRAENLDAVLFLGDYIYEYPGAKNAVRVPPEVGCTRSMTIGGATRSTSWTPTSRPCTPRARGS